MLIHLPTLMGRRLSSAGTGASPMRVISDRAVEAPAPTSVNRRKRRAYDCLADALRFQLESCREAEGLAAIVVSDQLGFCVAHSGGDGDHAELAARLPILAN